MKMRVARASYAFLNLVTQNNEDKNWIKWQSLLKFHPNLWILFLAEVASNVQIFSEIEVSDHGLKRIHSVWNGRYVVYLFFT